MFDSNDVNLGVWFSEDITNILLAVSAANLDAVNYFDTPETRAYRAGFEAAIRAIALAFGIPYNYLQARAGTMTNIIDLPTCE